MPTLVHLADERDAQKIQNGGIKVGKFRSGIFCMPVLPNFYVTHQWLRELKRGGVKTFVGVYFKIDSSQMVFAGKYNEEHKHISLGQAIKEIMNLDDPLGYELIIDRKIEPDEIEKVRRLPQTIGWRYKPDSKGSRPCGCDYCIRSSIKANKIRERLNPKTGTEDYQTLLNKIRLSQNDEEVENLLYKIQTKKRRDDPSELMFLLDKYNHYVNRVLASTLGYFRHNNTESLLVELLSHPDPDVRDYSAESIMKIKGKDGLSVLLLYSSDPVIKQVIEEHRTED
ncbi:HEAT repeat domain-containing protein [Flavihumibacter petaseus]|uniref:HEAT repeat domain-containing protein n=1 Tax=Flavihumibacter petaseus NBRC 106054 TaxID=1220578 RepID=A0A0E9N4N5_9BACT|nr:HEAT repeat domain-containing protein [Flavihumibacter petaseus]GAO44794.1 hypothetical protein FPE01S_04_00370 [Flavihumibacter petaseus NBRC 106054]